MRQLFIISIFFCCVLTSFAQEIEVYDNFDEYESHLIRDKDKVYVVNYWATWCAPCIKELPYFEKLKYEFADKGVEVVLVSLDFKNQYEKKLLPFIKEKELDSRIIHMTDPNSNKWIDRVHPDWSGAIPITQFMKRGEMQFMEKSYHSYDELKSELEKFILSIQ